MTAATKSFAALAALALAALAPASWAGSALESALARGGTRLNADQIAERLVGNTGTWVSADSRKRIAIYYGRNNDLRAVKVGGGWTGSGYYGIADTDDICISWNGRDNGRLRCLTVVLIDGAVTKFNADGSLNGSYESIVSGKTF